MLPALVNRSIDPLVLSQLLLSSLGTQTTVTGQARIPTNNPILIVSNHRSAMDVAVLMAALNRPIHFACHHYMRQVPLIGEMLNQLGFLPLDAPKDRYSSFFDRSSRLLQQHQAIGIFPEGATPMVQGTAPDTMTQFQRGFAHLALRAPVNRLVVLPVAIAAQQELNTSLFPVRWLQSFDASEPMFDRPDWHPLVLYRRVNVSIGTPILVDRAQKQRYHGRQALDWVNQLTETCHQEIQSLLIRTW